MSHRRYALVGAGHRAQMYVDAITGRYADEAVLVAICEPNPVRARYYVDRVVAAGLPARGATARCGRSSRTASSAK